VTKIESVMDRISGIDSAILDKAQRRLDSLTKPLGSLGKLEEIAKQIVGITGRDRPVLNDKAIFTFAADHGVVEEGVSAYPKEVTAQMVYNFLRGGAGINVLARHAGARVVVADVGVAEDLVPHKKLIIKKIGRGTNNIAKGQAMTREMAIRAIETGIEIFESEKAKGIDLAGTGEMGIGNTTPSTAITAVFTGSPIEDVTGRGTGIDDASLSRKINIIKKALKINSPDPNDPIGVLAKVGGFEIGAICGVILASSATRVPIVIDGFISGAAALLAFHIEPRVKEYMIASHSSVESGHKIILEHIGIEPIMNLKLRLGEGTGSAIAMNIIDSSVKIYNEMATFEEASVSQKKAL